MELLGKPGKVALHLLCSGSMKRMRVFKCTPGSKDQVAAGIAKAGKFSTTAELKYDIT